MTTQRQFAANRRNAKRSTGPRTTAGKQKSSRNALRHGLSLLDHSDSSAGAMVSAIAGALAGEQATENQLSAAKNIAHAQVDLARIYAIRAEQWSKINLNEILGDNTKELRRLASLDRYERYARTRRRKASKSLGL